MSKNVLKVPDYLSIDYETYKRRISNVLRKSTTFKDFDFEGSNISLLIELLGYQSELNTYYLNKIAQEVYDDSAQLYENVHRIASMKGFKPRGYIASKTYVTVSIPQYVPRINEKNFDFKDSIYIPYGTNFTATILDINETSVNKVVNFVNTTPLLLTVPNYEDNPQNPAWVDIEPDKLQFTFRVPLVQGELVRLNYTGADIIDGKIYLPFYSFNHDSFDSQTYSTMSLSVNGTFWERVPTFYSKMSNLNDNTMSELNNNVFALNFNKYKQYVVEFSSFKNVPDSVDEIEISIIRCDGANGNIGRNLITRVEHNKIINLTKEIYPKTEYITITNPDPATGGQNPQEIQDLVDGGKGNISSQERCVTRDDYEMYLKSRQDILGATAYGEQEISKKGNVKEYNKVHISVVPSQFTPETIVGKFENWKTEIKEAEVFKPLAYYNGFVEDLKTFLEPRKFITTYEQFEVPDLVHFAFHIGLKVSPYYNFTEVTDVFMDKLEYYFTTNNRSFGDTISFMEMHNWLLDIKNVTQEKTWELIKGIENIVFRQIWIKRDPIPKWKRDFYALPVQGGTYTNGEGIEESVTKGYNIVIDNGALIYPPNDELDFPQYTKKEFLHSVDNKMKVIRLGPLQFPVLSVEHCGITKE